VAAFSGVKTVTTAGTAVKLGSGFVNGSMMIKALAGNSGLVYVGNDGAGDVAATNGFQLAAGQEVRLDHVGSMADVILDAAVNGEGVCWLVLWL